MAQVDDVRDFNSPTIHLGGRERVVQFDLNAFAELEKRYGTIAEAMKSLQAGQMKDVRAVLWAGLIHEEAIIDEDTGEPIKYNITPYQVGGWVRTPAQMQQLSAVLAQAMAGDLPSKDNAIKSGAPVAQNVAKLPQSTATVVYTEAEKAELAKQEAEEQQTKNS